jgi:hypothetical protein
MKNIQFLIFIPLLLHGASLSSQIVINEISARNETTVSLSGEVHDWIEILNTSDAVVQTTDYYISDDPENPQKWQLPNDELAPGEYRLIFASGQETNSDEWHAPFKIGAGEETILLSRGTLVVQQINALYLESDHGQGAFPDGANTIVGYSVPTPGSGNDLPSAYITSAPASIVISHPSGVYTESIELTAYTDHPGSVIRYTTDGSVPVATSMIWPGTINIQDNSPDPMVNAIIPTTDSWVPPLSNIRKASILRFACFAGPIRSGEIYNSTYFIDPSFNDRYQVPVVSVVTDSHHLFSDETGIYVAGNATYGNFVHKGPSWERRATVQHFESDGTLEFEAEIGIRIHGRSSRFYPQKSLRLYYHNEQPEFSELFETPEENTESLNSIILRAPDRLFTRALFTDALVQKLGTDMRVFAQKQRPVILFINGEYWGIHLMSERVDEHFVAERLGTDEANVRLIEWDDMMIGEEDAIAELSEDLFLIGQTDASDETRFGILEQLIDTENLIDYACLQVLIANEDFPNNNLKIFRANENAPWAFILYDGDACLRDYQSDLLSRILEDPALDDPFTVMFRACMKNDEFQGKFVSRLHQLISNELSAGRIMTELEHFKTLYEPLIGEHINRWVHPDNTGEWLNATDDIAHFIMMRHAVLLDEISEQMGSPLKLYPNPARTVLNIDMPIIAGSPTVLVQNLSGLSANVLYDVTSYGIMLHLDTIDTGLYYVTVEYQNIRYTERFLVTH